MPSIELFSPNIATVGKSKSAFRASFSNIRIMILLVCVTNQCLAADEPGGLAVRSGDAFAESHQAAVNRKRRIIFNNDGGETARSMSEPTAQCFLELRTTKLIGTQVDTIVYCTRSSGFGLFTHFSKVGEIFTTREGSYERNQIGAMLEAGIDPLTTIIDYAHKHGIELIWSMRMNDTHDAQRSADASIIFKASKLKNEHPEYLLGTAKKPPKIGAWTAVNYALPEVRELAFRYFEEICQNYDVDGVELDFFRHPVYFPSTTRGQLASAEELAAMTDLVRRIRSMTQAEGRRRNRPILLAIHCPDSVEYSRAMGLALDEWMQEGLLDLWIAGGTFHMNDWDYSVRLARQYGIKVYPSLDNPRVLDDKALKMRMTPAAYRARAADAWGAGPDGMCLFNADQFLDSETFTQTLTNEIGSLPQLAPLDRDYFASSLGQVNSSNGNYPLDKFQNAETLNGRNPKRLAPGKTASVKLSVIDDLSQAGVPRLKLRLRFDKIPNPEAIRVSFNGEQLQRSDSQGQWVQYDVAPAAVRQGVNRVDASLSKDSEKPWRWIDALLEVRY